MEFGILGPLEVVQDGQVLDLGGQKQRALLAVLLLHANEVVSTDGLMDALWEDAPPERAQKALQVYVSGLRKVLGAKRIETRSPGYRLRIEEGELDLARFEELVTKGKPKQALALWRGPPLSDFAYSRFARSEIVRLEELRLAALEERIEEDLAVGRHAALVGELEALVSEHPLRERLRGQLMLCLYRSGRQADALEAYQETRRALTEELGIEPGRELRELQQAILKQDPALDLAGQERVAEESEPSREPVRLEPSVREARKTVTAVVADFRPTVDRLDAETLRRIASRCFDEAKAIFERHGGTVEQSIGGTVSAVFGIPVIHEDDALRAIRAGAEVRQRIADLGEELETSWGARVVTRIGVGTGEVVTGGASRAIGGPVSIAVELQRAADPDRVLLDDTTLRLVRGAAEVEHVNGQIRLVGIRPAVDQPGRLRSPMVGRERERRRLHDTFEQAVSDRACHLFTVLGLAGVGKSRLVEEFLGDLVSSALVTRGRCLPYGEGITYWPVLEAVKELVGLDDADPVDEAKAKLLAALEEEQGAEQVAERIAEVTGLVEAATGAEEGFAAVRALFQTLARARPLVVVFDDIHWGESTFLDFVEYLADWTRDVPLLLICLARPELLDVRPGWAGGKLNATSAMLEPLSNEESALLVDNLTDASPLDEPVRARIVSAAEGNPLFVEEMLALALEEGDPGGDLVVPPTIQALLAARLDRLTEDERAVIEAASVEGKVFHELSVETLVSDARRSSVHEQLMALVRKELIRPDRTSFPGDHAFRFRHLLIRDAAYESVPKEARAELHEGYARLLERRAGERAVEYEEIIGYHLERAFRYRSELGPVDDGARALAREAAERLAAAGRRAFVRTDAPAAVNLLSRAVSLLPPDDPARVDLVPTVRVAQGLGGDLGWAVDVLDEAIAAGDDRLRAHALVQRGLLRLFTGPDVTAEELIEVAEQAIEVFEASGDDLGLARAWRLVHQARYLARRAGPSVEAAERALVHARRAANRAEEMEVTKYLLVALILGPARPSEGARRCEELLEDARGEAVAEANALGSLAYFVAIQGRTAEAHELVARGRRIMGESGLEPWTLPFYYVGFALWEGDPTSAEREFRPGYEALGRIGEKSSFGSFAAALGEAVYAQGRYDEAMELAQEAREAARPIDVQAGTAWRMLKAKVLARRGEIEAAEALARETIAFVEQSDFLDTHGHALQDLAEVLRLQGRRAEAMAAIEDAVQLFEAKGNVVAAARARKLLDS